MAGELEPIPGDLLSSLDWLKKQNWLDECHQEWKFPQQSQVTF